MGYPLYGGGYCRTGHVLGCEGKLEKEGMVPPDDLGTSMGSWYTYAVMA